MHKQGIFNETNCMAKKFLLFYILLIPLMVILLTSHPNPEIAPESNSNIDTAVSEAPAALRERDVESGISPEQNTIKSDDLSSDDTQPHGLDVSAKETEKKKQGAIIAFTFDDGYISDYELAFPILREYGISGTSYIIPKYPDDVTPYALSWDQIREMADYGWAFGCHTYAHTDLKKMTPQEIQKSMEMVNAAFVRQGLGEPKIHAFPFGSYNQQAIDAIKPYRIQMRKAYYETKLIDLSDVDPYQIDSVSADMRSEKRLKEHKDVVDRACRENGVIVFRCHCLYKSEVGDMGDWPVQTDSRLFKRLVEYCVEKGCKFVTMTQLIELYS